MKLKIEHLSSGYDEDVVLKDLSLEVEEGEFLSLLGPSGCGKSTLMKTVVGIRNYNKRLGFSQKWITDFVYQVVMLAKKEPKPSEVDEKK